MMELRDILCPLCKTGKIKVQYYKGFITLVNPKKKVWRGNSSKYYIVDKECENCKIETKEIRKSLIRDKLYTASTLKLAIE